MSILEAMAAGKPVIATNVGGNSEIIKNEVGGLLIANGTISEIIIAVTKLLDHPELKDNLSLEGLKLIQKDSSWDSMVSGYLNLYESAIQVYVIFAAEPSDIAGIQEAILTVYHQSKTATPLRVSTTGIEEYDRQAWSRKLAQVLSLISEQIQQ